MKDMVKDTHTREFLKEYAKTHDKLYSTEYEKFYMSRYHKSVSDLYTTQYLFHTVYKKYHLERVKYLEVDCVYDDGYVSSHEVMYLKLK